VQLELLFTLPIRAREEAQRQLDQIIQYGRTHNPELVLKALFTQLYLVVGGYGDIARGEACVQEACEYARKITPRITWRRSSVASDRSRRC